MEYVYANILTGDYFIPINGENGFTLDFSPVFIVPIAAEIEPLFNFGISISSLTTYETQIRVAFASIPVRTRLTIQWLEIYFFNFVAFNGLEVVIQDFSSLVINDASFITLLGAIEYDGVALTSDEISAEVFEWDFYQQIIYNFITSPAVGIDLTVDSVSTTAIKRLITRIQISRQNSLERVLETIQFQVDLFLRFFVTADFDFSFGRRIEIAFSGNRFSNAAVCMVGISQVIAPAETVTTFITDYETVFDSFISAQDFVDVFNIQLDIEAYYQTFYRVVRLNVYQMCGQSFFNNFVTDVDTQTSLRQFYLYLDQIDLESPLSIQAQLRSFFVNLNSRLVGVLSDPELTQIRELTYEPYFNSLVFVIRILALFETRINTEFTFDLFNQLTFESVSWDFTAATLNDETFFQTVVSEAISSIDTTFDLSSIVSEIQTEYESLIKITEFQRGPRLNFQLLCTT